MFIQEDDLKLNDWQFSQRKYLPYKVKKTLAERRIKEWYKNNIFPYPTKVVQSAALDEGEAIMGIAKKYFMGVAAGDSGTIEYSDEYQFLEDNRVYITKFYGMGRPKDNNAFQYLDVSNLQPAPMKVEITNTVDNPVNTKAKA